MKHLPIILVIIFCAFCVIGKLMSDCYNTAHQTHYYHQVNTDGWRYLKVTQDSTYIVGEDSIWVSPLTSDLSIKTGVPYLVVQEYVELPKGNTKEFNECSQLEYESARYDMEKKLNGDKYGGE